MSDKPWKVFERYIAGFFSYARNSLSGGNSKLTRSDSTHPNLFISCKYTRSNNRTLRDLLTEEREKADKEGKTAVLCIGEFDDRQNTMVILHLKDLKKFAGLIHEGKVVITTDAVAPAKKRAVRKRAGNVAG